jgi:hypothetical protein
VGGISADRRVWPVMLKEPLANLILTIRPLLPIRNYFPRLAEPTHRHEIKITNQSPNRSGHHNHHTKHAG